MLKSKLLLCGALVTGAMLVPTYGIAQRTTSDAAPSNPPRDSVDRSILPIPEKAFAGKIAPIAADATPDSAVGQSVSAPRAAPNILLIMTDDVGFGASSTFGGPVPTPTFERLARAGVRYNNFHTTAMCSPTRAALLTGRNHHNVGFGILSEMASGFPGYSGRLPRSAATIAKVLTANGYSTAMLGKHHNVPPGESSAAGPFDRWPTGLGFEYFYGFRDSETNQWAPALVENTRLIEPDYRNPEHLDTLLADRAIRWLRDHKATAAAKPFFLYYATGTPHAPQHAPREWIEQFKGKFDRGWDVARQEIFRRQKQMGIIPANTRLTPRPDDIPSWDSITSDRRRIYARMMEVYAATLAHADHQIGRVIDELRAQGKLDNTLIIFIQGDNGASQEGSLSGTTSQWATVANGVEEDTPYLLSQLEEMGGPKSFQNYPVGWAWAMNTPFKWAKQVASHLGGTRNAMVMSWPGHVPEGGHLRSQFGHVVDILPTILEAAGLPAPKSVDGVAQQPLNGTSLAYSFAAPQAPERHKRQYFELMGNRSIYSDGWMASTTPRRLPWIVEGRGTKDPLNDYQWELYDLRSDFSQAHNLAAAKPEKLAALKKLWLEEAQRNNVLPIDDRYLDRPRSRATGQQLSFSYHAGDVRIPAAAAPNTGARSWTLTADVEIGDATSGVMATLGGRFGGWGLFMQGGRVSFVYALSNQPRDTVTLASSGKLAAGRRKIELLFDYAGAPGQPAHARLLVDGAVVAEGKIPETARQGLTIDETFDVGLDTGTPISESYADAMPFAFEGKLHLLTVDIR
jgi:arylsulfatase